MIYFVQAGADGPVKIGHSNVPTRRLRALQSGSVEVLNCIRLIDGGRDAERWLHKQFANCRIQGEWFQKHPRMLDISPPAFPKRAWTTPIERAIEACGSQEELARKIGRSQQVISYWKRKGSIPAEVVVAISAASGIRREELRPDIYGPVPLTTEPAA